MALRARLRLSFHGRSRKMAYRQSRQVPAPSLQMKPAKLNSTNSLTDVERRWYQCFAADILSGRFVWEQLGIAFQLILAGSCGILGILWLGWSSGQEFAFIIIGLWVGIARNLVKITCMFQGMQNLVTNFEKTGGVSNIWYIVNRIKYPEIKELSRRSAKPSWHPTSPRQIGRAGGLWYRRRLGDGWGFHWRHGCYGHERRRQISFRCDH